MLAEIACLVAFHQGPPARSPLPDGTVVQRDLTYGTGEHARHRLDLYKPAGVRNPALVIMIHGGAFMMGDKGGENVGPWVEAGFAVAPVNYRLSGHARFPAAIEDVKAAIRWLRANASSLGVDASRFGVFGASAGGNLAALAGTTGDADVFAGTSNPGVSSRVQAVVDWFGPTDFLMMDRQRLPDGQEHDPATSPESRYLGGPIQTLPDLARHANPITFITKSDPPFFIAHGDQDRNVPYGQSEILVDALKKAGVSVTFLPMKGEGHGFRSGEPLARSIAFMKAQLGK